MLERESQDRNRIEDSGWRKRMYYERRLKSQPSLEYSQPTFRDMSVTHQNLQWAINGDVQNDRLTG